MIRVCLLSLVIVSGLGLGAGAADEPHADQFLNFIRAQAAALRADDRPPKSQEEWQTRRAEIRQQLAAAWGLTDEARGPVEVRKLDEFEREGYRVEKLLIQTMPDVWMPALAYVPSTPGKHPAILSVHGHWRGAKVEPTIQSRCIGAAKLGFFVLCVDAFGAGERGIGKQLGEYHGEIVGAMLFPIGRPLSGIQVYENMRCVDYLQTRLEVDPGKIGITGASGGGNQTMYAGAWDERFGAVVPVCSVGNYQAYLGPACCMCEVVPGALRFTEEEGVLALTAPRALMPCNVTQDGIQFSIREARKSLVGAQYVYDLLNKPNQLYHSTFRWKHDYHQPIREAMYGWMTQHLKGEGDGSPIPEPAHETEDPEELRLFPNDTRPDDWLTLPQFAAREGRLLLESRQPPKSADGTIDRSALQKRLVDTVFGGFPEAVPLDATPTDSGVVFVSEPGITLKLQSAESARNGGKLPDGDVVLLLNLEGAATAIGSDLHQTLTEAGMSVVTLDLRATGAIGGPRYRIGRAPDHHSAEWALWIGRPLLGQWTWDVLRAAELLKSGEMGDVRKVHLVGDGPAGLVALAAAAASDRFESVVAVNSLASYISEVPYENQYLGLMAPGILRDIGDIADLASLAQPRRMGVVGGVNGAGARFSAAELASIYRPATQSAATPGGSTWTVTDGGHEAVLSILSGNTAAR